MKSFFLSLYLHLVEFQIALIEANLDRNEAAYDKAREKEMRLALKLAGLRKVELATRHQPRPNLKVVKP